MEIGAILFSLAMILLVAAYVLQPIAGSERAGQRDSSQRLSALQAERDRVLDAIQEIDMDHSMGKVLEEDYQRQRQALALEGAQILRKIDELQSQNPKAGADQNVRTPEMELDAAVALLRGKSSPPSSRSPENQSDSRERACPECGEAIFHGDRFCANCGAALEEQVA